MLWRRVLWTIALAGGVLAAGSETDPPPVLRASEPADTGLIVLPGVAPAPAPLPLPFVAPPPLRPAMQARPLPVPPVLPAPSLPAIAAALAKPAEPPLPPDFARESALFCHRKIGTWTIAAGRALLGAPRYSRPAFDDDGHTINGRIYAFADPSGRYRELELDFAGPAHRPGRLRTVFAYPWDMTWGECQRIWGGNASATPANKGRKFYSYNDRRLDVLVDPAGKVISLGLY